MPARPDPVSTPAEPGVPAALRWDGSTLWLLDQTRLPHEVVERRHDAPPSVREAIARLEVRGAPAIGIAAAYGLVLGLDPREDDPRALLVAARRVADELGSARPTAVNLRWALERMLRRAGELLPHGAGAIREGLVAEACRIHDEDRELCRRIGTAGEALIAESAGVLTHCNAGALATGGLGTATAPMYLAHAAGRRFRVWADETRPLLQGARLTAWELQRAGIDVRVLCDGAAASLLTSGEVDLVIVGADRIAASGDVANKIGTLGLAIAARHAGVPFYVAAPYSTIDPATPDGAHIEIEQRAPDEVRRLGGQATTPPGVAAHNPAFDVTPAELISGLITERGILSAPLGEAIRQHYGR